MAPSPNLKQSIMEVENVVTLKYQQLTEVDWISILLGLSIYH